MAAEAQVDHHHTGGNHHQHDAQCLGDPDGRAHERPVKQIQAVRPQALDPGAAKAVPQEIKAGVFAVKPAALGDDKHHQQQADQVPKALIEKGGVYFNILVGTGPQPHPPGQGSLGAEGLPVHKIAPPANGLANEQAHGAQVRHGPELQLLFPGIQDRHHKAHDNGAVNGQAAVPNGDHAAPIQTAVRCAVQVQVKKDIVQPGTDDAGRHRPQHHVQHVVLRQAEALGLLHAKQQARQHSQGQDDAIPIYTVADVDGDGVDVALPVAEQAGKADGHITQSCQLGYFLSWVTWARSR